MSRAGRAARTDPGQTGGRRRGKLRYTPDARGRGEREIEEGVGGERAGGRGREFSDSSGGQRCPCRNARTDEDGHGDSPCAG